MVSENLQSLKTNNIVVGESIFSESNGLFITPTINSNIEGYVLTAINSQGKAEWKPINISNDIHLNNLKDVDVTDILDNQILTWDSDNSLWIPGNLPNFTYGDGLSNVENNISVNVDDLTLTIIDNSLEIKNGGVTNNKLTNPSIDIITGDGLNGGGTVNLGESKELTVDSTVLRTSGNQEISGNLLVSNLISIDNISSQRIDSTFLRCNSNLFVNSESEYNINIYSSSPFIIKLYPLGTILKQNGKIYRYCYISESSVSGKCASRVNNSFTSTVIDFNPSLTNGSIICLNNSGVDIVNNDPKYIDGTILFKNGINETVSLTIKECTSALNGEEVTFYWNEGINSSLGNITGSTVAITGSKYYVYTSPNNSTINKQIAVGFYINDGVVGYYWLQSYGVGCAFSNTNNTGTISVGDLLSLENGGTDSGRVNRVQEYRNPIVGRSMEDVPNNSGEKFTLFIDCESI